MIDLSIITATRHRHSALWRTIDAVRNQSVGNLRIEHIVVSDGKDHIAKRMCEEATTVRYWELPEQRGAYGAFAKDEGIRHARGKYVCFWDDDNLYSPHAAATLFATAIGFDMGVVQTSHRCPHAGTFLTIPRTWNGQFVFQDIDTMCVCVRRELAIKHRWGTDNISRGTDFRWLMQLSKESPTIRFVAIAIGSHC